MKYEANTGCKEEQGYVHWGCPSGSNFSNIIPRWIDSMQGNKAY